MKVTQRATRLVVLEAGVELLIGLDQQFRAGEVALIEKCIGNQG